MAIFCEKCGYQNSNSAKFCKGCGGEVIATTAKGTLMEGIMLENRYEIKRLVKSGGMGAVYEAMDHKFKKIPCAVKEMLDLSTDTDNRQYFIDRFMEEAQMLHTLKHPNLPTVKDYFVSGDRYYLVMEYVEGSDLDTVMRHYGSEGVPEESVIEWAKEILDVLSYLHNQDPPIVYRDLKPGNVMIRSSDNKIMLVDFGIARRINPESDTTKTSIGTPAFAPKELLLGKPEIRSDIYCLGATMHCLLTGVVPVIPGDFSPVRRHKPYVSQELDDVVMCALSVDASGRYQNAMHMKNALDNTGKHVSEPPVPYNARQSDTVPYEAPPVKPVPSYESDHLKTIKKEEIFHYNTVPSGTCKIPEKKEEGNKFLIPAVVALVLFLMVGGVLANNHFNNPVRYLAIAEKELEDRQYKTAKEAFEKVLRLDKKNIKAFFALADIAMDNMKNPDFISDRDSAIDYCKKAVEFAVLPEDKKKALEKLLEIYMDSKDYNSSKEILDKLAEYKDIKVEEYAETGNYFLKSEKWELASECFTQVLKNKPENSDALKSSSRAFMKMGDYKKALEQNKKILSLNKSDKTATVDSGLCYYNLGDYKSAVEYFKKAEKLNPSTEEKKLIKYKSFDCYVKAGKDYMGKKNYKEAKNNFELAASINKSNQDLKSSLATCYVNLGKSLYEGKNYTESEKYFQQVKDLGAGGQAEKDAAYYIGEIERARGATVTTVTDTGNYSDTYYYNTGRGNTGGSSNSASSNTSSSSSTSSGSSGGGDYSDVKGGGGYDDVKGEGN
ncbi:MAG: protein kinase [Candidatus Eremiobacterota bacterium]